MAPRFLIRADASPRIGSGHVMRCLTLAAALAERGAEITFACASLLPGLDEAIAAAGYRLVRLGALPPQADEAGWDAHPLPAAAQQADAAALAAQAPGGFAGVIVDHYLLDVHWEEAVRPLAERLLVVDDLANRRHACGLLLDQTFGRAAADYRPFVPDSCVVLAGSSQALLRPEFARERPAALARRKAGADPERLLVSLGATDIGGRTAQVVRALLEGGFAGGIDIVVGGQAPSLAALQALAGKETRVRLHVDTRSMAALMRDADLAIGAAGTSALERCCLALPSVALVLADNQRTVAANLAAAGASFTAESPEDAAAAALRLWSDAKARALMAAAAAPIADGGGAGRVADCLLGTGTNRAAPAVTLRRADTDDAERLWLWRNDPLARAMAKTPDAIPWDAHARWFAACLADPGRLLLVGEAGGAAAGTVRFDPRPDGAFLASITVAPSWRGRGVGAALLDGGCRMLEARAGGVTIFAEIRLGNAASERIFARCGFVPAGAPDGPWARYVRTPAA